MLVERVEAKWIDSFAEVFELSKVKRGDYVGVLSETTSRAINVHLTELALQRIGAKPFHIVIPSPRQTVDAPVRSTGNSNALVGYEPAIKALADCPFVVDLTVEMLLHSHELPRILKGGARYLGVSNEHPDVLERLRPDPEMTPKLLRALKMMKEARTLRVTSRHGTDLTVDMQGCRCGSVAGYVDDRLGLAAHWPGGLVAGFPKRGATNGVVVMAPGDLNLTFKRYVEQPIRLTFENDYAVKIEGDNLDTELMRAYLDGWDDREALASSHIGWGMNPKARWDAVPFYDKGDFNGTEQRAYAGNFLFSMGANEHIGRHTLGHFDLPMRGCTLVLDNTTIIENGRLLGELA
jgi:2,5-dihydroxypyridine 5,6-dioxygenase